ncbi:Protein O-linked-mannose beta-1,4-N-acetylglucosaminyltransferase 2 [Podochytrium sp. JEL0797]|nr:Protein O-linked-mannose beta-1,4-N-acetylglucosaminyltransferase 2 [Podochytrium sp. JEL0797]
MFSQTHRRATGLPTHQHDAPGSTSAIDMRVRASSSSSSSSKDDGDSKKRKLRRGLFAVPGPALARNSVPLVAVLLLVLVAFAAGLAASARLFSATPRSLPEPASPMPPQPPAPPQQQGADEWRRKYESLIDAVAKSQLPAPTQELSVADPVPSAKQDEKSPKQEVIDAIENKEKENQMKKLMDQSGDSIEGVKLKESTEKMPVFGGMPEIETVAQLPASSVWCQGDTLATRTCKFRNICYSEKYQWFIVRNNASDLKGVPTPAQILNDVRPGVVEISTIEDHPYTAWSYDQVSQFAPEFQNRRVRYHTDFTILFKRFHANNIMHSLHDDVLPLFHHIREVIGGFMNGFSHFEFDLRNHRIQFVDDYEVTETFRPFQYLTDLPIGRLADLTEDPDLITCFRDATAGVRKLTTWYQYGFSGPQGPIENKFVNGLHVRMVSDFFTSRLGLMTQDYYGEANDLMLNAAKGLVVVKNGDEFGTSKTSGVDFVGPDLIIILSRTRNRLIMNEDKLAEHLEKTFKHQVLLVRNEDHTLEEQIILMRRAKVLVAMHGSIMIMGMFCRKGTVMLELYPYAVPSDNYTPYRTMAQLSGMNLVYRAWENKHPENSVSHPDWPEALGGIAHLSPEEQKTIQDTTTVPSHKCCVDPYWLFRIYQDTTVDIQEISTLLKDALQESARLMQTLANTNPMEAIDILPPAITGPMFNCLGEGRPKDALWIRWAEPWNGAKPDYYIVRSRIDGDESEDPFVLYQANSTELFVKGFKPGTGVIFSVKSVVGGQETSYGDEAICTI